MSKIREDATRRYAGEAIDPRTKDLIQRYSGQALDDAVEDLGRYNEANDIGDRQGRRHRSGRGPSPLSEFIEWMMKSCDNPFRVEAHVRSAAKRVVRKKDDHQLVTDYWLLVMDVEPDRERRENIAKSRPNLDLEEVALEGEREAATELEIAAHAREIKRRALDPRQLWMEEMRPRDYRRQG